MYLNEIFPEDGNYPFNVKPFKDEDTYTMHFSLIVWLYECFRHFEDEASKVVDFSFYTFDIDGETLTQIECIHRMKEDCRVILENCEDFDMDKSKFDFVDSAMKDLFKVLTKVFWAMWW